MARHRPATEGGYQRGEETRARIIEAALRLFGAQGYDGASTRDIAREAGVNAPALQYYFDNKEGVYLACIDRFVEHVWTLLEAPVAAAERVAADPAATDAALMDAYLALQGRFADFLHERPEDAHWRQLMARERAGEGPAAAFERINAGLNRRVFAVTSSIIGRLSGEDPADEHSRIRTILLDSQVSVFRLMRRHVLASMDWETFGKPEAASVREVVQDQTRMLLEGLAARRDAARRGR